MNPEREERDSLAKTRVLLLDVTGMVADIVRQVLSKQSDVELVGSIHDLDDAHLIGHTAGVDVVITAYAPSRLELRRFDQALSSSPGLRVLAIEDEGRTACMYALSPTTTELGPLSPETLVAFVHASARAQEGSVR